MKSIKQHVIDAVLAGKVDVDFGGPVYDENGNLITMVSASAAKLILEKEQAKQGIK